MHAPLDRLPLPLQSATVAFRYLCDSFRGFDLVLRGDSIVQHVYFPCRVLGELRRLRDLTPMLLRLLLSVPRRLSIQSRATHQTLVFQLQVTFTMYGINENTNFMDAQAATRTVAKNIQLGGRK